MYNEEATKELQQLLQQDGQWCTDAEAGKTLVAAVFRCVAAKANVMADEITGTGSPLLHYAVQCRPAEVVVALLSTPFALDFTETIALFSDSRPCTRTRDSLLHSLLSRAWSSRDEKCVLVRAALKHLMQHPIEDIVDWRQKNRHRMDVISVLAENQLLSKLLPDILHLAPRAEKEGFYLTGEVWSWDWEALRGDHASILNTEKARFIQADRLTGRFYELSQLVAIPKFSDPTTLTRLQNCVRDGADVTLSGVLYEEKNALLNFVKANEMNAVLICLRSPRRILFTATDRFSSSPLHLLCSMNPRKVTEKRDILRAVVQHLEHHADDEVDWGQQDGGGLSFISIAAENQLLSLFWPEIQHLPYFMDKRHKKETLFLSHDVWSWDVEALGDDRVSFTFSPENILECSKVTGELFRLSHLSASDLDLEELRRCVEQGADVSFQGVPLTQSVKNTAALQICLQSPLPIDFSAVVSLKTNNTLLHDVVSYGVGREKMVEQLRAIVCRIETHPEDTVDWNQKNNVGLDFISMVAERQLLSLVWPVVKNIPYFADNTDGIALTRVVWSWDWAALGDDAACFAIDKAAYYVEASRPTGELFLLSQLSVSDRERHSVEACVKEGADVTFEMENGDGKSTLMNFFYQEDVEAILFCLQSPQPIPFTVMDLKDRTPLQRILILTSVSSEKRVQLLRAAVHHVVAFAELDAVHWSHSANSVFRDLMSDAAEKQLLSLVWPVVKEFFARSEAGIVLQRHVWSWDLNALNEDRARFSFNPSKLISVDVSTWKLHLISKEPTMERSLKRIRQYVSEGADVTFAYAGNSTLVDFFEDGDFDAAMACLRSPRGINFMVAGYCGNTPLHTIFSFVCVTRLEIQQALQRILERPRELPDMDTVFWGQLNDDGLDFISTAAEKSMVAVVWPIVKGLPYFHSAAMKGRITLLGRVWQIDWEDLGEAEQRHFHVASGVIM